MANFIVTRKAFNDALDRMSVRFSLVGEPGDPIADRLHGEAECPAETNPVKPQVSGGGLVKDAGDRGRAHRGRGNGPQGDPRQAD